MAKSTFHDELKDDRHDLESSSFEGRPSTAPASPVREPFHEPIAIIGMSYHLPGGVDDPDKLWKILGERTCTASEFPKDRFNIDAFWSEDPKATRKIIPREAHFLNGDIASFDAGFFSMAPHEVGSMDPQQRGLLESAYQALENSGITLKEVSGTNTSVHIGSFTNDFAHLQLRDTQNIPKYNAIGSAGSILANRLSWFFNLHGESMYIDTACSSSLTALSVACQGLQTGNSEMAIVGASNIILSPEFNIALSNLNFLSPSGRCKSFDASGDGYGRGEGFTTLVLKPITKALADGNPIRAVIRAFGTNQDGYTSGGITQPNKEMQIQLIRDTYRNAGLSMAETRFFEAHGTGTAVGDPIEAGAIGEAFFPYLSKDDPMYVGALKSNFGHLEGTSGLAAVVKAALAVERGVIPPNTNFSHLNPMIDADFLNLRFPQQCVPWPTTTVRRASVNSFGFGGSNAHLVIEAASDYLSHLGYNQHIFQFPLLQADTTSTSTNGQSIQSPADVISKPDPELLILSAADEDGVNRQARSLASFVKLHKLNGVDFDQKLIRDMLWTLNTRRTSHIWKSYALVRDVSDLTAIGDTLPRPIRQNQGPEPRLGYIFTGQGAQWPRMGLELLQWSVFEKSVTQSQAVLKSLGCDWDVIEELGAPANTTRLQDPEFSQVISTVVQIGLVQLAEYLDIRPTVVVGHSSGEIAAAFCAGLLSHDSAVKVAYYRGKLAATVARSQTLVRHGMASVGMSADEAAPELASLEARTSGQFRAADVTVSCINSLANITLSGPVPMLDLIVEDFSTRNVFARKLKVDIGYHSPQMQVISDEYLKLLSDLTPRDCSQDHGIKMVSSVNTGYVDKATACSGEYWVQNMISPVQFVKAVQRCLAHEGEVVKRIDQSHLLDIHVDGWVEIGPHPALAGPTREILKASKRTNMLYTSFLNRGRAATESALEAVGLLHCNNFHLDLATASSLSGDSNRRNRVVLDLPKYAFNHMTTYWEESQRSRSFRNQIHRLNPLLGTPAMDWNPLDARWRWTVRKDEVPWVVEHQVQGSMLYPAAGMITMAIEGTKMLLEHQNKVEQVPVGFELQDVSFLSPLVITELPQGTDIQLSMVPTEDARSRDVRYKFRIFVLRPDDTWQETCNGFVRADFGNIVQSISAQDEEQVKISRAQQEYLLSLGSCGLSLDARTMYEKVDATSGLRYGPTFQPLTDIRYNTEGTACARILACTQPVTYPRTIHPATLDGIFQLAIPALSKGLSVDLPTLVPARLTRLWIAQSGAGRGSPDQGPQEVAHIQAEFLSRRSARGSIQVLSTSLKPCVVVDELELTELARENPASDLNGGRHPLCYEMDWKPDHSLLSKAETEQICSEKRGDQVEPAEFYEDIELMLTCFAAQALEKMDSLSLDPVPSLTDYVTWLRARVNSYLGMQQRTAESEAQTERPLLDAVTLERAIEKVGSSTARGFVNATVGRNLHDILLGRVDPLQLLFQDTSFLANFYEELNTAGKAFDMLSAYLDVLVHKDAGLTFLEVGAGTGATTAHILNTIALPGPRFSSYDFTDISAAFFPKAEDRFADHGDKLRYRVLNIEDISEYQSSVSEGYDVVIAAHVLHATSDVSSTLANVRKLLKPSGKLILIEMTTPDKIETGFIFGTLAGWWRSSEQWRRANASAVFPERQWNELLQDGGFAGIEHTFRDWDSDRCHGWSIMVTSATNVEMQNPVSLPVSRQSTLSIIVNNSCNLEKNVAEAIKDTMPPGYNDAEIVALNDVQSLQDAQRKDCLMLCGLEQSPLTEPGPDVFSALQKVLTTSKSVLWASCATEQSDNTTFPYWAMIEGLCRTCRSEDVGRPISTLILESATSSSVDHMTAQIVKIFASFQASLLAGSQIEPEYREHRGRLCVNRLAQAKYLDEHVSTRTDKDIRLRELDSNFPVKLDIKVPGLLDTLQWVEDESTYEPLDPHQVEIRVQAIGVNFKECLILLGRVNTDKLGSECAGYVHRVGSAVSKEHLQVGDRVALGSLESYRTFVRAWDFQVIRIPDKLSFVDAAAIPTAFCTAYHSLINVAHLKRSETVLIHAAAGGTGQAAIQVARYVGAEIFATVGSVEKKQLLMDRYEIAEDHIFYSRDSSFADGIRRMTQGRGVDVVLNSLSGKLLVASWELIASFGRFVEIGRRDIDSRGYLPMYPFLRNATFTGVDLATIVENRTQKDKYVLQTVFDLVELGVFQPSHPVQKYSVSQTEQALRLLQSGKSSGKIVLEVDDRAVLPLVEGKDSRYRFRADATYVLAGGLGGIGRQIAAWLARRGAKHILLLSRSDPSSSPERLAAIENLRSQGVNVQSRTCDISDREALANSVGDACQTMPSIKGCFQAAMVLRDRPFGTMTHQEWVESVMPKVQGSSNLASILPADMDFFVMLSSTSGIFGNAGQSNYAAGNTFIDELARHLRRTSGTKAVALDLGMILGEGFVAENKDIHERLLRLNLLQPLRQDEIFAILDFYCDPSTTVSSERASQVTTGIKLPGSIRQSGQEVPEALQRRLFSSLHQIESSADSGQAGTTGTQEFSAQLREAGSIAEAGGLIAATLKEKLCKILGVEPDERSTADRMNSFGVDSLIALELRNWLMRDARADLAVFEILGDSSLHDIGLAAARCSEISFEARSTTTTTTTTTT